MSVVLECSITCDGSVVIKKGIGDPTQPHLIIELTAVSDGPAVSPISADLTSDLNLASSLTGCLELVASTQKEASKHVGRMARDCAVHACVELWHFSGGLPLDTQCARLTPPNGWEYVGCAPL